MIKKSLALLVLVALFSAPAFAKSCPLQMKKIDKALAKNPTISAGQFAKVKELRALGEKEHKSREHRESSSTLWDAMDILGIS
ncbi:MAG: hypothetical protein O6938_09300 [Gammaproteobacteria bacterium]|nr:hypothetical protein [Gammaproteobacteria bacterium]MCZ6668066.1 hypothetical protein [Gammaproteobacteria bacterium]MCZ6724110.1 hypothetical protein [Gammaproteobacteria bacterium]